MLTGSETEMKKSTSHMKPNKSTGSDGQLNLIDYFGKIFKILFLNH